MKNPTATTITINFSDVQVTDLKGNVLIVNDLVEIVSNALFISAPTIPLSDAARLLYKGENAEVSLQELQFIINFLEGKNILIPIAQVPLIAYLKDKLPIEKDAK